MVDWTERQVQRPKDLKLQDEHYSGKKKHYPIKNQLVVNPKSQKIIAVSDTNPGTIHDKKLFDKDPLFNLVLENSLRLADLGYMGTENTNPRLKILLPSEKTTRR